MTNRRVSVITGASKAIGLATAERLDLMGLHIIGLARRAPEKSFSGELMEVDSHNH